jgi:hypothetical protein
VSTSLKCGLAAPVGLLLAGAGVGAGEPPA